MEIRVKGHKSNKWLVPLIIFMVISICIIVGIFIAHSKGLFEKEEEPVVQTEAPTPEQTPEPTPTPDPHIGQMKSFLTGEWVDIAIGEKRPVAVMLNNAKGGVPQNGLSYASVIYEAIMEGGETRLLGIFEDYTSAERIGSVRSCRPYFVYFAKEFQAIYSHYGQAWVADDLLNSNVVDNVSGLKKGSDAYYRSTDRKAPHNVFTNHQLMVDTIAKLGYDTLYEAGTESHYKFAQDEEIVDLPNGQPANYVKPGFAVNKPWFQYNTETGLYHRFQYGSAQLDELNGQQIAVRNIIIQYCRSSIYSGSSYVNLNVTDGGNGMFITNGKAIPVTWKKDSEYGKTRYYDGNGNEICLNQGKTWVCVMQKSQEDSLVISEVVPGV